MHLAKLDASLDFHCVQFLFFEAELVGALAPLTRQDRGYEDTIFALKCGLKRGHPFPVQFLFLHEDLIVVCLCLFHLVLNLLFEIPYSNPAVIVYL